MKTDLSQDSVEKCFQQEIKLLVCQIEKKKLKECICTYLFSTLAWKKYSQPSLSVRCDYTIATLYRCYELSIYKSPILKWAIGRLWLICNNTHICYILQDSNTLMPGYNSKNTHFAIFQCCHIHPMFYYQIPYRFICS